MAMRVSSKIFFKALQFSLFVFLVVYTMHSYQQLKVLASQATDPLSLGSGYQEFLAYKAKAMTVILLLLGGIFVLEPRFYIALAWLKNRPNPHDRRDMAQFLAGLNVAILLLSYIVLTVKYIMVVRSLGL